MRVESSNWDWCPHKKRHQRSVPPPAMCGHGEKVVIYNPTKELSSETDHAGTSILDFYLQNCEAMNFCCLSHQWMVIMATLSWLIHTDSQLHPRDWFNRSTEQCSIWTLQNLHRILQHAFWGEKNLIFNLPTSGFQPFSLKIKSPLELLKYDQWKLPSWIS